MYVPHAQSPWPAMHLLIRATSDPVSLQTEVRRILRGLDADVPLAPLAALEDLSEAVVAARASGRDSSSASPAPQPCLRR
jgi:hypothetical protein